MALPERDPSRRDTERRSRELLYKGLTPTSFSHYFQKGGISPRDPRQTWITNSIERALDHAHFSPLYTDGCMAVFEGYHATTLTPRRSQASPLLSIDHRDFSGNALIPWKDVLAIFVTQEAIGIIRDKYREVRPKDLTWEEFEQKLTVIETGDINDFRLKSTEVIRRVLPIRVWGKITTCRP